MQQNTYLRNEEYTSFFKKISHSNEYKTIQKYFYRCDCVSYHMVGHIALLIRDSKATTLCEWFDFYKTTVYYSNLKIATKNLHTALLEDNHVYTVQIVSLCLKTFIFYKSWIGCKKEQEAMKLFNDENYYSIYPHPKMDFIYGVDFVLVHNGKYTIGIQVKPMSYTETDRDWERMKKFYRKYKAPIFYLRYNWETQEFYQKDIEYIEKRKQLIIEKESN